METENLEEKIEIKIPAELFWLLAKYAAESRETPEVFTTKILIDAIRFILRRQAIEVNEGRKRLFDLQATLFNQTGEPEDYQEPYYYDWEGVKEREDKKEVAAEEYIPPEYDFSGFNFEQSNSSSSKDLFHQIFGKNSDEENSTVNHSETETEYQDKSMSENDENIKDQNPKSKDTTKEENWDA